MRRSLADNSRGAGLALIEGVMGYYDGMGLSDQASAWALARATATRRCWCWTDGARPSPPPPW